jgi:TNF receptor-associated factor 4
MRKDLDNHLKEHCPNRDYTCYYCGEEGTYASITQVHDLTCEKKILPCPNAGCGDTMERQQVPEHVSKCPHTVVSCKYKGIGCDAELERKDMAAHEQDDKLHLHMALDTVNSQQVAIKSLQGEAKEQKAALDNTAKKQKATNLSLEKSITKSVEQTNSLQSTATTQQEQLQFLMNREPKTFKLSGYHQKKMANGCFIWSPPVHYGHFKQVWVYANNGNGERAGTHVSVYAHTDGQFVGTVTITLLNQLEDNNHHTIKINFTTTNPHDNLGYSEFIAHSELHHDPLKNTQYLKDNTLYFSVSVQAADRKPWLECTPES